MQLFEDEIVHIVLPKYSIMDCSSITLSVLEPSQTPTPLCYQGVIFGHTPPPLCLDYVILG